MDRKINFNVGASSYVPRNLRQQSEKKKEESNIEVIVTNQGGKNDQYSNNSNNKKITAGSEYTEYTELSENNQYSQYNQGSEYDNYNYYKNQDSSQKGNKGGLQNNNNYYSKGGDATEYYQQQDNYNNERDVNKNNYYQNPKASASEYYQQDNSSIKKNNYYQNPKAPASEYYQQDTYNKHATQQDTYNKHPTQQDTYNKHATQQDTYNKHATQQDTYNKHPTQQDTYNKHPTQQDTYNKHPTQQDTYNKHPTQQDTYTDKYNHNPTKKKEQVEYNKHEYKPNNQDNSNNYNQKSKKYEQPQQSENRDYYQKDSNNKSNKHNYYQNAQNVDYYQDNNKSQHKDAYINSRGEEYPAFSKNKGGKYQYTEIEKDIKDLPIAKVLPVDIDDDLFDDAETYGDFETENGDDLYLEDDLNDGSPYDSYIDYGKGDSKGQYESTTDRFLALKLAEKSDPNQSQRNHLIFSNKEGFTDYVEELTKSSKRGYSQITDSYVNVLMIAEKPSIAKSISEALGGKFTSRRMGGGACIINFDGYFGNTKARFTVSSVMGHVYTSDFQREHNDWNSIDYLDLYDVPIAKIDANKKTRIPSTLQRLAQGKDILCLWLDCDKEGENICYETIYNVYPYMNPKSYQQIYRAKFSSLTKPDLKAAFNNMKDPPNKFESLSVDARQVIDLKIGVSFTRFLTSAILPGIKGTETKVLSYGPCQTPTLWFCVNRQNEINQFKSKEYFKINAEMEYSKIKYKVPYKKKFFDKNELNAVLAKIKDAKSCKVVNILTNKNRKEPPAGLNTVQMLRTASSYLKMSPHETMHVAEKLYTMGYMTYPRTETTKYASSFDFLKSLNDFANHPTFGKSVTALIKGFKKPALRGVDVGDHPPITPSRVAVAADLKGDHWRLYEFICTNFFASLSDAAEIEEKVVQLDVKGEIFEADSLLITKEGFLAFMPWKRSNYVKDFPLLKMNTELPVLQISSESNWTDPPPYLSESDLIKLMESNKVGTDASMPVHIQNISERGYVKVNSERRLIPTKLGKALIESLSAIDPEIVHPNIRADIENYVDQVAKGNKTFEDVLTYAVNLYKKKFLVVRQNYEKLLNSFKKYFEIDLMEMNKVYKTIKSKNEALKIQNMVKKDISQVDTDLKTCSTCKQGKMYVEFDSIDKYLLYCTNCKLRTKIVRDAVKIKVHKNLQCQKCNSHYIEVELENPFLSGETSYTGCLFCDPNLKS